MPEKKHHVFSARTTEEGLKMLDGVRKERGVGWDELVIGAVCAHYGLDRAALEIPKKEKFDKNKDGTARGAKNKKKGEADGKDNRRQQNGQESTIRA